MPNTVPNQRVVAIHRETTKSDFLGIKNTNWQAAARDLGAQALLLYLYFASNANGYTFALSLVAIRQAIAMPSSTYRDQFLKLVDKGYLVQRGEGNTYDFAFGLNWSGVINDERVATYSVEPLSE